MDLTRCEIDMMENVALFKVWTEYLKLNSSNNN